MKTILIAATAAIALCPLAAEACEIKTGTYQGDWAHLGTRVLAINSVDATCTQVSGTYNKPDDVPNPVTLVFRNGQLILPCSQNGECRFAPIAGGAVLKATYFDSKVNKQTNSATFERK